MATNNSLNASALRDSLQKLATREGISSWDLGAACSDDCSVQVDRGEAKQLKASQRSSITVRVWNNDGLVGITSTTDLSDAGLEQALIGRVKRSQFDIGLVMDPEITEGILQEIDPKIREMSEQGLTPLLITTSELRLAFRRFMEPSYPQLVVLSYQELPTETQIEPFGAISIEAQSLPPDIISAMEDSNSAPNSGEVPVAA